MKKIRKSKALKKCTSDKEWINQGNGQVEINARGR
jgi:hypothetical protein